jgi:hypothetical protein
MDLLYGGTHKHTDFSTCMQYALSRVLVHWVAFTQHESKDRGMLGYIMTKKEQGYNTRRKRLL